jgi:hypothetical protein
MSIIPTGGPPLPKDKYQLLKDKYYRIRDELRQAHGTIESYDRVLSRRNGELINVHQQLEDAKRAKAQVFSTKVDALSISEVGKKVTALNEEICKAAATSTSTLVDQHGWQAGFEAVHQASVTVRKAPCSCGPEVPTPLCSNVSTRAIYRGPRRKLVLAFDVGTTYSGITYR